MKIMCKGKYILIYINFGARWRGGKDLLHISHLLFIKAENLQEHNPS